MAPWSDGQMSIDIVGCWGRQRYQSCPLIAGIGSNKRAGYHSSSLRIHETVGCWLSRKSQSAALAARCFVRPFAPLIEVELPWGKPRTPTAAMISYAAAHSTLQSVMSWRIEVKVWLVTDGQLVRRRTQGRGRLAPARVVAVIWTTRTLQTHDLRELANDTGSAAP